MSGHELLSVDEMGRADAATIASGIPGLTLMENAGQAVADITAKVANGRPVLCLCGPGNNGGDGYVAARYLKNRGYTVTVAVLGDPAQLKGDALENYQRWSDTVTQINGDLLTENTVIIDALFGAGLQRDIDGIAADVLNRASEMNLTSVAVDLPSGISGDTGVVMGTALPAAATVTFFRKKPGHLLYPGRDYCGDITVADIGIQPSVLNEIQPHITENTPENWQHLLPFSLPETAHKYDRGHLVIIGGANMTGAARLAARAARRAGAGLVTLNVPKSAVDIYRAGDPGNIVEERTDNAAMLADHRRNTILIGPGLGTDAKTRALVTTALATEDRRFVLDADALTAFADDAENLLDRLDGRAVITPHEGEFRRLFDFDGDKLSRARQAARACGAVVLLKGADTIIASPDGRAAINANAPKWLGTAGSGDVLAGITAGFIATGMPIFEAASAAVWCHGAAATAFGPGLIAEDLADMLPHVFQQLM